MSYIEDILYEALELGIREEVIKRVNKLKKKHPHKPLNNLYDEAFTIENENKHEN